MLKRLLNLLRPESAGDLMEESADRSRLWMARQILSALIPSARPFASYWNDVRYSARTLAKNPGFASIAIGAIALGIGVNTGIFSLLNGVALRPLPLPGASKLVNVYQDIKGIDRSVDGSHSMFSSTEYAQYRDTNQVFTGLAAYHVGASVTMRAEKPVKVEAQLTSCNYFDVLGRSPEAGRGFVPEDCAAVSSGTVAVLSDDLWRGAFGADPAMIGKTIVLNRIAMTVVGIAPPGFRGTEAFYAQLWIPYTMQPALQPWYDAYSRPNTSWLTLIGRLKEGASLEQARADLRVIAGRIDQAVPKRRTMLIVDTANFASMPEAREIVTSVGAVILAAVGMVLLIACANVANLLLARAAGREREMSIRLSVGATRWRLIRQLLTESLLIALAGGLAGSLLAFWSFEAILEFLSGHLPRGVPDFGLNISPDWRVFVYSLVVTVITGVVFGLAPAWRASRPNLSLARGGGFLRHALVGGQVAVCMVLLIAAGLLMRALYHAQTIDPGFATENITAIHFDLRNQGYNDRARAAALNQRLIERIHTIPGVDAIAQAVNFPLSDDHISERFGHSARFQFELNAVSPEYFTMLHLPIVHGRSFTSAEVVVGARVALVTESAARRVWNGEDPLGQTLKDTDGPIEIIGVVKDAQVSHLGRSNESYLYLPAAPEYQPRAKLLVHAAIPIQNELRKAIHDVDPDLAIEIAPLEDNLEWFRAPSRIVAILAATLGVLALLLASIGVYGVVSFAVSRRVREIGIRMALGADRAKVTGLVLRHAMWPVGIGVVCGIALCAAVSRVLSSMLFGISSHDPIAFSAVPLLLIAVALFASYIPVRRATNIDPMAALRHE